MKSLKISRTGLTSRITLPNLDDIAFSIRRQGAEELQSIDWGKIDLKLTDP